MEDKEIRSVIETAFSETDRKYLLHQAKSHPSEGKVCVSTATQVCLRAHDLRPFFLGVGLDHGEKMRPRFLRCIPHYCGSTEVLYGSIPEMAVLGGQMLIECTCSS